MRDLLRLAEDFLAWSHHYGLALYPWQADAFGEATRREAGHFLYRLAGISVPRGNGKSYAASAVASWRLLTAPPPILILSEALDFEGSKVCLDHGKAILQGHSALAHAVEFRSDEIRVPSTGSRWIIRSREHTSSRGLHPDLILYDEIGWARDDELFSSLLAAQASCVDPLMLVVSTVGRRRAGPLWRIKELAETEVAA